MVQFEADMPRPDAAPYYDLAVPDSDEEYEPAASDLSGMTGVSRDVADSDDAAGGAAAQGTEECVSSLPAAAAAEASVEGVTEAAKAQELPPMEAAVPPLEAAAEGDEAEPQRRGRDAKRACRHRSGDPAQPAAAATESEAETKA